jgi:hypothetical protein
MLGRERWSELDNVELKPKRSKAKLLLDSSRRGNLLKEEI